MTQGLLAFFFSRVVVGVEIKVLAVWQVVALGSDIFFSANHNEHQNTTLN